MKTVCDTGLALCPHKPQCDHLCHFTDAGLEAMDTRKIKPYPVIPDDIDRAPDTWHTIGAWMLGAIMTVLLVICLGLFFTGLWVWSLLI
jgi:hypothetical protein